MLNVRSLLHNNEEIRLLIYKKHNVIIFCFINWLHESVLYSELFVILPYQNTLIGSVVVYLFTLMPSLIVLYDLTLQL